MFDNISQSLFNIGAIGYIVVVPILRFIATVFMIISTYKLMKARQDSHRFLWLLFILISPFWARVLYEIYRRFINKIEIKTPKGSTPCLVISIIAILLSSVITVISIITLSTGYIKSEIDMEPINTYYDVHGNECYDIYDIPLYDEQGNLYTFTAEWTSIGYYISQDGEEYDAGYCYLNEDGYFYYDGNNELVPYEDDYYYTDGENIYFSLAGNSLVYWDEDGSIWYQSGRFSLPVFDTE